MRDSNAILSENYISIYLDPKIVLSQIYFNVPRVKVFEDEKWIKHVYCDGARFHVISYNTKTGMQCSEPDCIINKSRNKIE